MDKKTKEPVKDPNPYLEPNRAKEPKKEQGFENKFAKEEKKLTEPEKQIELLGSISTKLGWIVFFLIVLIVIGILIYFRIGQMRLY